MAKEKKNWIQGAVNPKHKGYCTPVTKPTCTPRRKAFAMNMKKHHGFHKKEEQGGTIDNMEFINELIDSFKCGGKAKKKQDGGTLSKDYIKEAKDRKKIELKK